MDASEKPVSAAYLPPVATTHAIERTNPKGQPFRGRCIQCGATDLRPSDALKPCPNPTGMTQEDALLAVIDPPREDAP